MVKYFQVAIYWLEKYTETPQFKLLFGTKNFRRIQKRYFLNNFCYLFQNGSCSSNLRRIRPSIRRFFFVKVQHLFGFNHTWRYLPDTLFASTNYHRYFSLHSRQKIQIQVDQTKRRVNFPSIWKGYCLPYLGHATSIACICLWSQTDYLWALDWPRD